MDCRLFLENVASNERTNSPNGLRCNSNHNTQSTVLICCSLSKKYSETFRIQVYQQPRSGSTVSMCRCTLHIEWAHSIQLLVTGPRSFAKLSSSNLSCHRNSSPRVKRQTLGYRLYTTAMRIHHSLETPISAKALLGVCRGQEPEHARANPLSVPTDRIRDNAGVQPYLHA